MSDPEKQRAATSCRQYRFDDFTLDAEDGFLRRGAEEIVLRPKAFEVLAYLVEHHGRLVTKDALMNAIWPDTEVTDNSLARCLVEIRRALADDAQQMIRTMPRRGYVFTPPVIAPVVELPPPEPVPAAPVPHLPSSRPVATVPLNRRALGLGLVVPAIATAALITVWLTRPSTWQPTYTQITNFTDSAVAPVLSPDGRMVAFLRSDNWLGSSDQIYVKSLPNGEPVQLTDDPRYKWGLTFSPDGSRIAYGTAERGGPEGWKTYTLPVLGGEPSLLLSNASGLTWLDQRHVLFSEIDTGVHMGIVTATENRSEHRRIYFPNHQRAMAHFSYASPDRKWALVMEMDPVWQPCRLIPLDGSSAGRQVGPKGRCTSAGWSPDGKWMYFGAEVGGYNHLWRQRFPTGEPEQITFGPTEEAGIAVAPDGRSLITSIGMHKSAIWIHDERGERSLSSQGYVAPMRMFPFSSVKFSSDGKRLFYLFRHDSMAAATELWRTDVVSGRSEALLRDVSIGDYDLSSDEREVIFSTQADGKPSQLWIVPLDVSSPARLIASGGEVWPHFGPDGEVLFQMSDGNANYLARLKKDGSDRSKVVPYPTGNIQGMSPDRRWIVLGIRLADRSAGAEMALPVSGRAPRQICASFCPVAWAPDGRFLYVGVEPSSRTSLGKTLAIPLAQGEMLPNLPASGIRGPEDVSAFPRARLIAGWRISPGLDPSTFAYTKVTMHRNLFRISLRD
jgi:DNA-binding winged helix-turn-helix (wHTH) protein/Tol biopolymer transport system component